MLQNVVIRILVVAETNSLCSKSATGEIDIERVTLKRFEVTFAQLSQRIGMLRAVRPMLCQPLASNNLIQRPHRPMGVAQVLSRLP